MYYSSAPPIIFRPSHISLNLRPRHSFSRARIGNLLLHHLYCAATAAAARAPPTSGFVLFCATPFYFSLHLLFFNFLRVQCRNFHLNRRATPAARAVLSQSLGLARGWFSFSACRFLEFASRAWIIFFSPLYMDSGALADCCFYGLKGTSPLRAKCCLCWLVLLSLDSDGKRQINKVIMQCQLYHLLKFSSRYVL